jgi:hypothetical protein
MILRTTMGYICQEEAFFTLNEASLSPLWEPEYLGMGAQSRSHLSLPQTVIPLGTAPRQPLARTIVPQGASFLIKLVGKGQCAMAMQPEHKV